MAPENRSSTNEAFREFDAQLASVREAAKSLREERPSWFESFFHPGRQARRQADFSAAVAAAFKEIRTTIRHALAQQDANFAQLEAWQSELEQLREQQEQQGRQHAATMEDARARAAELERLARDQNEKIEQLVRGQQDLGNEFRERIQHLLDEQRVAIRQLSLKASEDAILSDRARRATELKLEELVKRVPPPKS